MDVDALTDALNSVLSRVQAEVSREVTGAQKIVAALNAEKTSAQNALANLQAQCKSAEDQLTAVREDLHRLSGLLGIGHDLKKANAKLQEIRSETAEATKALDKLAKEQTTRQAQVVSLSNEAQRQLQIRVEAEAAMSRIRTQLGVRP
jgi:chromosome segregation ATPase